MFVAWSHLRHILAQQTPMRQMEKLSRFFQPKPLTRTRIVLAILVAVAADGLQLPAVPFTWAFLPEIIDVIAMVLTMWLLGFHFLLLPTFIVEFIPLVDVLPTWTGCVVAVMALRRRQRVETSVESPPQIEPPRINPPG